jgi:CheY-like chemotaxis protein
MTVEFEEKPIALLVEDNLKSLKRRSKLLNAHGFQCIATTSEAEALREFRSTPTIDIVITDINLVGPDPADKSGVDLVRKIKERRPNALVMGYSGRVDDLPASEKNLFNSYVVKATLNATDIEKEIAEWRQQAIAFRKSRSEKAKGDLQKMRDESQALPEPKVQFLRDFLPGSHLPLEAASDPTKDSDDFETPDEILRRTGWRLRLVEAGFQLSNTNEKTVQTTIAVPLWLRPEANLWIAVVHEHSCIYHDAATEEEAVSGALELMYGYYRDFTNDPDKTPIGEMEFLRNYLNKVFGDFGHAGK